MKFTLTRSISAQQKLSRKLVVEGKTIAIVPTMGYLHEGHISLIKKGLKKADVVVTTIFVNPAQFSPGEDYKRYPRDTKGDLNKIKDAGGRVVFIPGTDLIYPEGYQTYVDVEKLTQSLEGLSRPTHFRGVTTIVAKLFNIVRPDFALFGMKDFQQATVISKMTRDLDWPIKVIVCPTVREIDGLAMSSRNRYLSPQERKEASVIHKSLKLAHRLAKSGIVETSRIRTKMKQLIWKSAPSAEIVYIAFTEKETLKPLKQVGKGCVVSLAVRFGRLRLIDNIKI